MEFLYFLEKLRTPFLDALFSAISFLGEEAVFILVSLLFLWCIDKKRGYTLLLISFFGLTANQYLKLTFRVPRPWVRDPSFSIVESARARATGYSFPSGHTQNVTDIFGGIACGTRRRYARIACVAIVVLVAFSRMYLGVHTPYDVGTSLLVGTVLVLLLTPLLGRRFDSMRAMLAVFGAMLALAVGLILYLCVGLADAGIDAVNYEDGIKNAYTVLGCALGFIPAYLIDRYRLRYTTDAPLAGQMIKLLLGAGIALLLKSALKAPLLALTGGHAAAHAVRYFILVLFAGVLWPMTFPLWRKVGKTKS